MAARAYRGPAVTGPRIGELFSGYGGLGLGVIGAIPDAHVVWHSENQAAPSKILAHHWPDIPNHGDITTIDWATVEPVDILTGGSPCQDLSHAGKRGGMSEGTRSNLWVSMREAIAQLEPPMVVWENVRGAYSAAADSGVEYCPGCVGDNADVSLRALGRVLGDLSELGYDTGWHGVSAADVGAPHRRYRVFVVATNPRNIGRVGGTGGSRDGWHPALGGETGHNVEHEDSQATADTRRETLGLGPRLRQSEPERLGGRRPHDVRAPAATAEPYQSGLSDGISERPRRSTEPARGGTAQRCGGEPTADTSGHRRHQGGAQPTGIERGSNAALGGEPTADTHDGGCQSGPQLDGHEAQNLAGGDTYGGHVDGYPGAEWGQYTAAIVRWETVTGRLAPAPAEPSRNGNPRLSPRFVEWLMGLPPGHVTDVPGITRNDQLRALGNGVVPHQAAAAVHLLLAVSELAA